MPFPTEILRTPTPTHKEAKFNPYQISAKFHRGSHVCHSYLRYKDVIYATGLLGEERQREGRPSPSIPYSAPNTYLPPANALLYKHSSQSHTGT